MTLVSRNEKRSGTLVLAVAMLVAILLPAASSGQVMSAPPSDPLGDVSGAPDVTQVGAHHVSGVLIFTVMTQNEPVLQDGSVIELRLDTDMDVGTGSPNGTDRLIHRLWTGSTRLCSWTGAGFSCQGSQLVTSTYVDGYLIVTTTPQALGIAGEGFDFSVASYNAPAVDYAPDSGTWRRSLAPPGVWDCSAAPICPLGGAMGGPLLAPLLSLPGAST